jgi:hypothetical protein
VWDSGQPPADLGSDLATDLSSFQIDLRGGRRLTACEKEKKKECENQFFVFHKSLS